VVLHKSYGNFLVTLLQQRTPSEEQNRRTVDTAPDTPRHRAGAHRQGPSIWSHVPSPLAAPHPAGGSFGLCYAPARASRTGPPGCGGPKFGMSRTPRSARLTIDPWIDGLTLE
jgi:hypothetical protein